MSKLAQNAGPTSSRCSAFVSTAFSSRTQDIETSVIARGDLWRVETAQGGTSTPLFLLQFGPILFVRASTLLLPIHLSKRHCLWYGFDRKEGLHSLCPAVWSKHQRWLAMAMLSLNPISCSFLDLQFPNGQMTYVAGDGLTGSAFTTAMGGLLQVQGRFPEIPRLVIRVRTNGDHDSHQRSYYRKEQLRLRWYSHWHGSPLVSWSGQPSNSV